eukprot:Hpha_TRINITY_DN15219_c1_g10::TRINITY_DN15219_c1_g10_i1::g.65410::m.65410
MTVHIQFPIRVIGYSLVATIVSLVAFTYTDCVHEGHCRKFLPSISATWVYPPENYVSRWVVGVMSIFMGLVQYALFRFDLGGLTHGWNKTLLYMGFIACVALSWVGAICDSGTTSCRGNGTVHGVMAGIFFVLYNLMMIIITIYKPDPAASELAMAVGSILAKVRFSATAGSAIEAQVGGAWNDWIGALIEWIDVLLIALWTMTYVARRGKEYRYGIVDRNTSNQDTPTPLDFWSMKFTTTITIVWLAGALLVPAFFFKLQGRWPQGGIPYISDTWVYPPGNWISRWACVGGTTVAAFAHVCAYYVEKDSGDKGRTVQSGFMTILAIIALFGGSVVGCVDESENGTIHGISAVTFFAGYDIFMLLVARQLMSTDCIKSAISWIAGLISILTKLRFHSAVLPTLVGLWPYIPQALEWLDATCIMIFLLTYFSAFGDRKNDIGLALYKLTPKEVPTFPDEP